MKAFRVFVNGAKTCTAGVGPHGVLSVAVTLIMPPRASDGSELALSVSGLDSRTQEHLRWDQPDVVLGDEIVIQVIDAAMVDVESARERSSPSYTLFVIGRAFRWTRAGVASFAANPTKWIFEQTRKIYQVFQAVRGDRLKHGHDRAELAQSPALELFVNDARLYSAGVAPPAVFGIHMNWIGGDQDLSGGVFRMDVRGLSHDAREEMRWVVPEIHLGDVVRIGIRPVDKVDPPVPPEQS